MPLSAPRCDETVAWSALAGHAQGHGRELDLRQLFQDDLDRVRAYTMLGDIVADAYTALIPQYGFRRLIDMLVAACERGHPTGKRVDRVGQEGLQLGQGVLHRGFRTERGCFHQFDNDLVQPLKGQRSRGQAHTQKGTGQNQQNENERDSFPAQDQEPPP